MFGMFFYNKSNLIKILNAVWIFLLGIVIDLSHSFPFCSFSLFFFPYSLFVFHFCTVLNAVFIRVLD